MEIRYYRDSSHNYLVLENAGISTEDYQYRMLENNKIDGIIPFSLRSVDELTSVYYEIDSRQSLENKYGSKKMSYDQLQGFIREVADTADRLGEFFLDEDNLIMRKDCIFEDLSTGAYSFLYYPGEEKLADSDFSALLLEIADMEDERASKLVYRLCESIENGNGAVAIILKDTLRDDGIYRDKPSQDLYEYKSEYDDTSLEGEEDEEDIPEKRIIKVKIPPIASFFLAVLFALVAGALWYLRAAYILTFEESILDMVVFMISVMMSLICLLQALKKNKNDVVEPDPDYDDDEDMEEGLTEYDDPSYDRLPENDEDIKTSLAESSIEYNDDENEETVFLNMDFDVRAHKLYRADGSTGQNISLENLPVTIGKLPEYADAVLRDPTVSRIHARISRTGNDFFVQDLNSKNGTYVNGKRLLPNEKLMLFPEDEVAFGKCTFSYR